MARRIPLSWLARSALAALLVAGSVAAVAASRGPSAIQQVLVDYGAGRLTIIGIGLHDGRTTPVATLGGLSLSNVAIVSETTIQGDIDLAAEFPQSGDYQLIVDPNYPYAQTADMLLTLGSAPAAPSSLAGQVCPPGSYVIGFDANGQLLCSEACGNGILESGESCDDGNRVAGDGCSANCRREGESAAVIGAAGAGAGAAAAASSAEPPQAAVQAEEEPAGPVIDDVEPPSVVYGTREVTVTVIGSGFKPGSVIRFQGETYETSVNAAGTELVATLVTRNLVIGRYAITVYNGPGMETTLRKALAIY
jgi:cysteine-rich repeat protein